MRIVLLLCLLLLPLHVVVATPIRGGGAGLGGSWGNLGRESGNKRRWQGNKPSAFKPLFKSRRVERRRYRGTGNSGVLGSVALINSRAARFSIAALIFAELLDYIGLMGTPRKKKLPPFMRQPFNLKTAYRKARHSVGGLLNPSTFRSFSRIQSALAEWEPKHKFVLGASLGYIGSDLLSALARPVLKGSLLLYLMSELNHVIRILPNQSLPEVIGLGGVEWGLESIRFFVHDALNNPGELLYMLQEVLAIYLPVDTGVRVGLLAGFITGAAAVV